VIDARQSEAQNTVIEALRGLGHNEAADHYTHFSYEMVALTPRCAAELGYTLSEEDKTRSYIEVSGRKGIWRESRRPARPLIASAKNEVDSRHPQLVDAERLSDCHTDRYRRSALFHAEVHQAVGDRVRLQRGAELRRRDRPLRAICRGARDQHLPQGWSSIPTTFGKTVAQFWLPTLARVSQRAKAGK
jgi:hypothetical protein